MLCPFCMLDYTVESPCFCHAVVRAGDDKKSPLALDLAAPAADFAFSMLAVFDLAAAAPYLGA